MAQIPRILSIRGEPCAVFLADLISFPLDARQAGYEGFVDVREGAPQLDIRLFDQVEKEFASSLPFNEQTLAPHAIRQVDGRTTVSFHVSKYSAYRAARQQFETLPLSERVLLATSNGLGTPSWFSHTFGVNLTVETSDGQVLLVRRSAVNESSVGQLSVSVSENSNVGDVRDGVFDPSVTGVRGLEEELGLVVSDLSEPLAFHSLIVQVPDGQFSLSGHAVTDLTTSEVLQRHRNAGDAHEAAGFVVIDFTPRAVEELLEQHSFWVPWAPPALIGALRVRFGEDIAEGVQARCLTASVSA